MMCERQIDWNIRDIVYLNTLIRVRTTHKTRLGDGCDDDKTHLGDGCDDDKTSPQKETHLLYLPCLCC